MANNAIWTSESKDLRTVCGLWRACDVQLSCTLTIETTDFSLDEKCQSFGFILLEQTSYHGSFFIFSGDVAQSSILPVIEKLHISWLCIVAVSTRLLQGTSRPLFGSQSPSTGCYSCLFSDINSDMNWMVNIIWVKFSAKHICTYLEISINGVPPVRWMVYFMENAT